MNVAQLMNALAYGALLTMLSSGLALIYGLRDVMNFAHGAFYMLGAFVSTTIVEHSNFWVAIVVVPILFLGLGALFEVLVLRPLRGRPIIAVALVTVGLGFVVTAIAQQIFG